MRVVARDVKTSECPPKIEPYLRQVFATPGKQYEVYAVFTIDGITFVSIVNDLGLEMREPIWLFDVVDKSVPNDWICNFFAENMAMILGPEFLARDAEAYSQLVDRDPKVTTPFWERVRADRQKVIRQILLADWDPIGVADQTEADLYDPHIPELLVLLEQQPSANEVFDYLWHVVSDRLEQVGDRAKTEIAAKKILASI